MTIAPPLSRPGRADPAPRGRPKAALAALALVAAAHAGVVALMWHGDAPGPVRATVPAAETPALEVRLIPEFDGLATHAPALAPVATLVSSLAADAASASAPSAPPVADGDIRDEAGHAQPGDVGYLPAERLDRAPVPASEPDFAPAMARHPIFARVRLRVFVSRLGPPDRVETLVGSRDVAEALADALRHASFVPGMRDGQEVAAYVDFEFSAAPVVAYAAPAATLPAAAPH